MVQTVGKTQFGGVQEGFRRLSYQRPGWKIMPVAAAARHAPKNPMNVARFTSASIRNGPDGRCYPLSPSITRISSAEMPGSDSAWPAAGTILRSARFQFRASVQAETGGQIMS